MRVVDEVPDPGRLKLRVQGGIDQRRAVAAPQHRKGGRGEEGRIRDRDGDRLALIEPEPINSLADRFDRIGQSLKRRDHLGLNNGRPMRLRPRPEEHHVDNVHADLGPGIQPAIAAPAEGAEAGEAFEAVIAKCSVSEQKAPERPFRGPLSRPHPRSGGSTSPVARTCSLPSPGRSRSGC